MFTQSNVNWYIRSNVDLVVVWSNPKPALMQRISFRLKELIILRRFSRVVKVGTIRFILTLVSINQYHLQQLDVTNVFLHE